MNINVIIAGKNGIASRVHGEETLTPPLPRGSVLVADQPFMARRREKEPPVPVTLRDITKVTGFTVNTVSRALKGKEDISVGTRRFIQREARRLGYIPNALAASLRSGRTGSISAIIPDISDPLFAILLRDIESRLKEKNFDLFIQNTDENNDLERRAVMASVSKKLDGVIICPCQKDTHTIAGDGGQQRALRPPGPPLRPQCL